MTRGIQAEIKQTKPFRSLEEEVFVALMRTADQLAWRGAEMLKQHGLSPTQYNALRILRGAGAKGLACSAADWCDAAANRKIGGSLRLASRRPAWKRSKLWTVRLRSSIATCWAT